MICFSYSLSPSAESPSPSSPLLLVAPGADELQLVPLSIYSESPESVEGTSAYAYITGELCPLSAKNPSIKRKVEPKKR